MRFPLTFRWRILLVVLIGVMAPLILTGAWLARGAQRSGEALLRSRLHEALEGTAVELQAEWGRQRGRLLDVVDSLAASDGRLAAVPSAERAALLLADLGSPARSATLRATDGRERLRVDAVASGTDESLVRVELPLYDRTGAPAGVLEAELPGSALFRGNAQAATAGVVVAAFDARTGASLVSFPFDAGLLSGERFAWGGDEWLVMRRPVREPPVVLAAAAPLAQFTEPFEAAARRGLLVVALISLSAFALATLLTDRVTVLRERSEQRALAAVGEFAATLAHEVRNPLTAVRVDLQYVEERLPPDSPLREVQASALREIERLDESVGSALQVARSAQVQRRRMDLAEPLRSAVRSAEPAFAEAGARLETSELRRPCRILGDPTTLDRLFLNLLLNAAQALSGGGRAKVEVDASANEVVVRVIDDGPGISPEALPHVFEPFYTTREGGSGLGLSVARRIARAHGGGIAIESVPGIGTTVTVRLPRADV